MQMINLTFGEALKIARKRARFTQKSLAVVLHHNDTNRLFALESDRAEPTADELATLRHVLQVDLTYREVTLQGDKREVQRGADAR